MILAPATGRCLCGAVRFESRSEPLSINLCHCESCRRHSGSPAAAFVTFRTDAVTWSGAQRASYRSSPLVVRSFCRNCGSPLGYEHEQTPDEIDLYLGSFDEPGRFPPQKHVHYGERVTWFDTVDSAPRYRVGSTTGEPPIAGGSAAHTDDSVAIGPVPPVRNL